MIKTIHKHDSDIVSQCMTSKETTIATSGSKSTIHLILWRPHPHPLMVDPAMGFPIGHDSGMSGQMHFHSNKTKINYIIYHTIGLHLANPHYCSTSAMNPRSSDHSSSLFQVLPECLKCRVLIRIFRDDHLIYHRHISNRRRRHRLIFQGPATSIVPQNVGIPFDGFLWWYTVLRLVSST